MTQGPKWDEWNNWTSAALLPREAKCAVLWAWQWSRPSQLVDHINVHVWQRLGMPGGLHHFIKRYEPGWMVRLLKLAYPEASFEGLEWAVGKLFGIDPKGLGKLRGLRQGSNRAASEQETKWLRDAMVKNTTVLCPWNDSEQGWMEDTSVIGFGPDFNLAWFTVRKYLDMKSFPFRQAYIPTWKNPDGSKVTGFLHHGLEIELVEGNQWSPPKTSEVLGREYPILPGKSGG